MARLRDFRQYLDGERRDIKKRMEQHAGQYAAAAAVVKHRKDDAGEADDNRVHRKGDGHVVAVLWRALGKEHRQMPQRPDWSKNKCGAQRTEAVLKSRQGESPPAKLFRDNYPDLTEYQHRNDD